MNEALLTLNGRARTIKLDCELTTAIRGRHRRCVVAGGGGGWYSGTYSHHIALFVHVDGELDRFRGLAARHLEAVASCVVVVSAVKFYCVMCASEQPHSCDVRRLRIGCCMLSVCPLSDVVCYIQITFAALLADDADSLHTSLVDTLPRNENLAMSITRFHQTCLCVPACVENK